MGDAPMAISPFYRVYVEDFDGDGDLDVFYAHAGPDKPSLTETIQANPA
jgi:hypothetical protein